MQLLQEHGRLWEKIRHFQPGERGAPLGFTDRLARENRWSGDYALRVVQEYKRFMFLLVAGGQPLTPSVPVDQCWHLHLLYTRNYWQRFCVEVLGRQVHHNPTKGGKAEGEKFWRLYVRTLELYQTTFDKVPPADIWPGVQERFRPARMAWIDLKRYFFLKKPF